MITLHAAQKINDTSSLGFGVTIKTSRKLTQLSQNDITRWLESIKENPKESYILTRLSKALKPGTKVVRLDDGSVYVCKDWTN